MTLSIELDDTEARLVQSQARASNVSMEGFSRDAVMRAARNAAYLARLDRSLAQMREGTGTALSWEQLEKIANGQDL